MLREDIDKVASEFLKVYDGKALKNEYKFDERKYPDLAHFSDFYEKLRESLRSNGRKMLKSQ